MGYVYLIGQEDNDSYYKIGSTRAKDVNKRVKQLQTGNSSKLYLCESFETSKPFKLEQMLHNRLKYKKKLNEWFELDAKNARNEFVELCIFYDNIIKSLKENPFF